MENIIEIINQRRSVRTFDPSRFIRRHLLKDLKGEINELSVPWPCGKIEIGLCELPQEAEPQKLGKYGIVAGARNFISVSVAPDIAAEVAAGYMSQRLVLWLAKQEVGSVWIGGVPNRKRFADEVGLGPEYTLAAIIPFGYAAKPRLLERLVRFGASASSRKPFEELFFRADTAGQLSPLSPDDVDENMRQVLEAVRRAPSSLNGQPWRFVAYGSKWYVYGDYKSGLSEDDLRMKHLDMGIALCHFDAPYQEVTGNKCILRYGIEASPITVPATWHPIASITLP